MNTITTLTPKERLDAIAARLEPCSAPDVFNGYDLCPCGFGGAFPCPTTEAAWLARGLDPMAENRRGIDAMRPEELTEEDMADMDGGKTSPHEHRPTARDRPAGSPRPEAMMREPGAGTNTTTALT